jgi:hypothetical protein
MERYRIRKLLRLLTKQRRRRFPLPGQRLEAPSSHGVYVIRDGHNKILHVGRAHRGQSGLSQRLNNHLRGQSSFVEVHLRGHGSRLRDGYSFQYLEVSDHRERALLEHFATGSLCPKHLGVGLSRRKKLKSKPTK